MSCWRDGTPQKAKATPRDTMYVSRYCSVSYKNPTFVVSSCEESGRTTLSNRKGHNFSSFACDRVVQLVLATSPLCYVQWN